LEVESVTSGRSEVPRLLVSLDLEGRNLQLSPAWQAALEFGWGTGEARWHAGDGRFVPVQPGDQAVLLSSAQARKLGGWGRWAALVPDGEAFRLEPVMPEEGSDPSLAPYLPLLRRVAGGAGLDPADSRLVEEALGVWLRPGFDTLICQPRLRFTPFDYQLRAAQTVLRRLKGRAILADEVGLGKTIEAGLVLSELYLRRMAAHCLIVVPAGLVEQWREELERKFALPALVYGSAAWRQHPDPWQATVVLASLATARHARSRQDFVRPQWDLVVVDEAHRLKNQNSASAQLVRSLSTRHLLLLTATPVENRLEDLFQLVSLVRPGLLGSRAEFRRRHGLGGGAEGARNLQELQHGLREVMVRHRRSEVSVLLPRRLARTLLVIPAAAEAELYARVAARVRQQARGASPSHLLTLRSVQRLAGSSPRALVATLEKVGWHDLAQQAATLQSTEKAHRLLEVLERHHSRGEKVVVFTGFRETLHFLAEAVTAAGIPAAVYHGGLARRDKEAAVRSFAGEVPLLLTTEAAGEGRNLQFCHVMINFDLPWNPMQIEQRLGRLHRIGQEHEVELTNLVARGTLEERVLEVLERKINLFELVVGELDMILGRVEEDFDFESWIFSTYVDSADDGEFAQRLDQLGDELARVRGEYLANRASLDRLLPEEEPA
jgi:SNF2 family DNA or RNA helicase